MTQPKFVPVRAGVKVRVSDQIEVPYPTPEGWVADRPAEITDVSQPRGPRFGNIGPDQGYGLKLARTFKDKLKLAKGEHAEDAVAGCLGVGLKRASLYGRAPVIYDFELAFTLWGFLTVAPTELIAFRKELFEAASHHYDDQRKISDVVPESTLRMTPSEVANKIGEWKSLIETV